MEEEASSGAQGVSLAPRQAVGGFYIEKSLKPHIRTPVGLNTGSLVLSRFVDPRVSGSGFNLVLSQRLLLLSQAAVKLLAWHLLV